MGRPDYKKITQVLNYLANREGGEINYMKALKLSYLADRLHLRKYGRLITDDKLVAMKNGALGSQAKDIISQNSSLPHDVYEYSKDKLVRDEKKFTIKSNCKDVDGLSETDIECIDTVFSALGSKDPYQLAELTHKLPEWQRYEYIINSGEKKVEKLKTSDLFKKTEDPILSKIYSQSEEELALSQDLFCESQEQDLYLV
jgi:uncharacterized phage-associated protein